MNTLSIEEHRVLFYALQRVPLDGQQHGIPSRELLEKHGVDLRLFIKWFAHRPAHCPSCQAVDAWTIGGEPDVRYSCMTCFMDVLTEKSIAAQDGGFEEEVPYEGRRKRNYVEDDEQEDVTKTDFLDIFFQIDTIATAFLESEFVKEWIPQVGGKVSLERRIPWTVYADVAQAFCVFCPLKSICPNSWAVDDPEVWMSYFFVVQGLTVLTFDSLRRLVVFAKLYQNTSITLANERPFAVRTTGNAAGQPLPLLYWLYSAQSSHASLSVQDIREFLVLPLDTTEREECTDRQSFAQVTELKNIERVAAFLRYLKFDEWTSVIENPSCIDLMNDVFYFYRFTERFVQPARPAFEGGSTESPEAQSIDPRPFRQINVSDEQSLCCFLLFFFQRIRRFPSVVQSGQFDEKMALWVREWYDCHGPKKNTLYKPDEIAELFPEPYLNYLLHILAITSCTPMHRLVYFVQLGVIHVNSAVGPLYAKNLLHRIDRYFLTYRPAPHREYGAASGPISLLSGLFKDIASMREFRNAIFGDNDSYPKISRSVQGSLCDFVKQFDKEMLRNTLTATSYLKDKQSGKKTYGTVESTAFLRSGQHVRNLKSLTRIFFHNEDDQQWHGMETRKRKIVIQRNERLIKQVMQSAGEIVYTHTFCLVVNGLTNFSETRQPLDNVIFVPVPTSFISGEAYTTKTARVASHDSDTCTCGQMVCFRSIFPNANFIISWFFYEKQWKILRVKHVDEMPRVPKIDIVQDPKEIPAGFAMCPSCRGTLFHVYGDAKKYPGDHVAQYIFDKEFNVLATSLGRYNSNTIRFAHGGVLNDDHSFPMFAVTEVERWDSNAINITLKKSTEHLHYPPLPEVLYPLTITDVITARQRIVEWLLFALQRADAHFDGYNLNTSALSKVIAASSLRSSVLYARYEDNARCTSLQHQWASQQRFCGQSDVTLPYMALNRIFDKKSLQSADAKRRNVALQKAPQAAQMVKEWNAFYDELFKHCEDSQGGDNR